MSVITIISIILTVIKYIPELISLVRSIIDFIHQLHKSDPQAAAGLLIRLRTAVDEAKAGNPQPLQDVANEVKMRCSGVACPPDLVGERD